MFNGLVDSNICINPFGGMTRDDCKIADLKKVIYDIGELGKSIDALNCNIDSSLLNIIEAFIVARYKKLLDEKAHNIKKDILKLMKNNLQNAKSEEEKKDMLETLEIIEKMAI
jgi:hypothetical protein